MRPVIVAALAVMAAAAPAPAPGVKYVTVEEFVTVYDDGTPYVPEATPTPEPAPQAENSYSWWQSGGHDDKDDEPAPAAPSAPAEPAPAPVEQAPTYEAPAQAAPVDNTPAPSYGGGQETSPDYQTACLQHHNAHRANHSAPAVEWDDNLASIAMQIAQSCVYAHDTTTGGGGYGQNIAAGAPASNVSSVITELFYNNEIGNFAGSYGQATPASINDESAFDGWGHFSQIVWKSTTKVGCATYQCGTLANTGGNVPPYFTVCNYSPPGNFMGEFADNVAQPLGYPSISWAST